MVHDEVESTVRHQRKNECEKMTSFSELKSFRPTFLTRCMSAAVFKGKKIEFSGVALTFIEFSGFALVVLLTLAMLH